MRKRSRIVIASTLLALVGLARADDGPLTSPASGSLAQALATELAAACPLAGADDQHAFDVCRQALFPKADRFPLARMIAWGAEQKGRPVRDMALTQFDGVTWVGLYLPLWMFTGQWRVMHDETERQDVIVLQTKFRNRLAPGQYPYPFWHSPDKWSNWQETTALKLHVDRDSGQVATMLRSRDGDHVAGDYPDVPPRTFDGVWTWRGRDGELEPRVTLFDGLYRADNPFLIDLERSYLELASEMRRSGCPGCHVPSNPNRMRRLLLLQTPAHAAGVIDRVIRVVREGKMPYEEWGEPADLAPALRATLLDRGARFQQVVRQAQDWEKQNRAN